MNNFDYIVMGGSGLVGSSFVENLINKGAKVLSLNSANFEKYCNMNITTNCFINANGNSYRFKANQDPFWDFDKSVYSLLKSLRFFKSKKYIFFSSIDVYHDKSNPNNNCESSSIKIDELDFYGTNKYLAESILRKYHSEYLILRLGSVVSPLSKKGPFYDLSQGKLFINPNSFLSVIDIENIHKAFFKLETSSASKEIYNLTGSGNVSVDEIIAKYSIKFNSATNLNNLKSFSYNVSNKKISKLVNIETSPEIADSFFNPIYNS